MLILQIVGKLFILQEFLFQNQFQQLGKFIQNLVNIYRYYHRSLNPSKLIAIGFSRIPKRFERFKNPLEMTERYYKLPDTPQIPGFREMKKSDVGQVLNQLQKFLRQFSIAPQFTKQEFIHWFLPRDGVINSYVVEVKNFY